MKPACYHCLLAHTAKFCILAGIGGSVGILLLSLNAQDALVGSWPMIGLIGLAVLPVVGIGYFCGAFIRMFVGGISARIQGWPFEVGDEVIVLAGKNKGQIARVYEVWETRGQVRLDLGREAKESVEDVFCAVLVTRLRNAVPPVP